MVKGSDPFRHVLALGHGSLGPGAAYVGIMVVAYERLERLVPERMLSRSHSLSAAVEAWGFAGAAVPGGAAWGARGVFAPAGAAILLITARGRLDARPARAAACWPAGPRHRLRRGPPHLKRLGLGRD